MEPRPDQAPLIPWAAGRRRVAGDASGLRESGRPTAFARRAPPRVMNRTRNSSPA